MSNLFEFFKYEVSDLMLFSKEIYIDLFRIYNQEIWPFQIISLLLFPLLFFYKTSWFYLCVIWLSIAYFFHYQQYMTINPYALYFSGLFTFQAVLFFILGINSKKNAPLKFSLSSIHFLLGGTLVLFSFFLQFFLTAHIETGFWHFSTFASHPSATALGTIGYMNCRKIRNLGWFIIPFLWLVIDSLTLYGLGLNYTYFIWFLYILAFFSTILLFFIQRRK